MNAKWTTESCAVSYLVKDAVVVGLRDADKLTVVHHRPHHTPMIQLLHGGGDTKTGQK